MSEFDEAMNAISVTLDLLDDVIENSESHTVEQAVDARATILAVLSRCKDAIAMLDQHLIKTLESPIVREGHLYEVKSKRERVRFDHGAIAGRVQTVALAWAVDENGEVSPLSAVQTAVQIMRDIYLSPSSTAKMGELDRYEIDRSVRTNEWGGKEVRVSPVVSQ